MVLILNKLNEKLEKHLKRCHCFVICRSLGILRVFLELSLIIRGHGPPLLQQRSAIGRMGNDRSETNSY